MGQFTETTAETQKLYPRLQPHERPDIDCPGTSQPGTVLPVVPPDHRQVDMCTTDVLRQVMALAARVERIERRLPTTGFRDTTTTPVGVTFTSTAAKIPDNCTQFSSILFAPADQTLAPRSATVVDMGIVLHYEPRFSFLAQLLLENEADFIMTFPNLADKTKPFTILINNLRCAQVQITKGQPLIRLQFLTLQPITFHNI